MQIFRTDKGDPVGRVALDIQLAAIECIQSMTIPRPQTDHLNGTIRTPLGWNVETIWNWTLQTMLVLKNLTTHYRSYRTVPKYAIGFQTLHHLFIMEAQLTIEQRENASLLLGREEIPDLYAHLICVQLPEPDGNVVTGMAAVLEGHTQAVSQISRHLTTPEDTVCQSLALLDMMCPRGWTRDQEATDEMPRWIHEQTGTGQWDFPNLMKFEINFLSGQPLYPSTMDDWSASSRTIWAPINCNISTLLHILLQHHPLGSLSEF